MMRFLWALAMSGSLLWLAACNKEPEVEPVMEDDVTDVEQGTLDSTVPPADPTRPGAVATPAGAAMQDRPMTAPGATTTAAQDHEALVTELQNRVTALRGQLEVARTSPAVTGQEAQQAVQRQAGQLEQQLQRIEQRLRELNQADAQNWQTGYDAVERELTQFEQTFTQALTQGQDQGTTGTTGMGDSSTTRTGQQ